MLQQLAKEQRPPAGPGPGGSLVIIGPVLLGVSSPADSTTSMEARVASRRWAIRRWASWGSEIMSIIICSSPRRPAASVPSVASSGAPQTGFTGRMSPSSSPARSSFSSVLTWLYVKRGWRSFSKSAASFSGGS